MSTKKHNHVYIELLKITSQNVNNINSLSGCYWTWGNHDYIKIIEKNDTSCEAMLWFKQTYEESHAKSYDGVEHQPLFLTTHEPLEHSPISNLKDTNKTDHIFVLTLFQIDYQCTREIDHTCEKIFEIKQEKLLNIVKEKIESLCKPNGAQISAQVFLDWGEADIVILFETANVQAVSDIITKFRAEFPVVRSYSLIIFPYTYQWLRMNWKIEAEINKIQSKFSHWFAGDNKRLDILTHYMTDTSHQEILTKTDFSPSLIFGDHDVQIIVSADDFTKEPYNPAEPGMLYRYSKTTPLLFLKEGAIEQPFCSPELEENRQYDSLIKELCVSFDDTINIIENVFTDNKLIKETLTESFKSAKCTLINLANYFTRLHETKHTPDVYIHLRSIFEELTHALKELKQYSELVTGQTIEDIFLSFDVDIKVLMSKMQQFLGIVSLSPRAFSEAHGSYMRSANAALKLVCTYHAAVYFMHQATKQRIDGIEINTALDSCDQEHGEKIEHENCAVLILPSRDAETINTTLFTSITPAHHMCVIEANFKSLYKVQEMLFLLAHEVGHFSGNRMRNVRQPLVIKAAVWHMILSGIFFEPLVHPYTKHLLLFSDESKEAQELVEYLDQDLTYMNDNEPVKKKRTEVVRAINDVSKILAEKLNEKLEEEQTKLSVEIHNLVLKYQYMAPSIEKLKEVFKNNYNDILTKDIFEIDAPTPSLTVVVKNLIEWMREIMKSIYANDQIPEQVKRLAGARVMFENSFPRMYRKYKEHFRELKKTDSIKEHMDWMSTLFADTFSDIYAINMLDVPVGDYLKFIFNNRLNLDSYADPLFLARIITVLQKVYKIPNNLLLGTIESVIPNKWKGETMANVCYVLDFQDFYLKEVSEYAEAVLGELKFNDKDTIKLIQQFYHDPENYLYALWLKGLTRAEAEHE